MLFSYLLLQASLASPQKLTSDSRLMSSMLREGFEEDEAPGPLKPKLLPLPDIELPVNVSEDDALHCSLCRL